MRRQAIVIPAAAAISRAVLDQIISSVKASGRHHTLFASRVAGGGMFASGMGAKMRGEWQVHHGV
jgi:hypothetical protein